MGTDKRERQRANRAIKNQQMARAQTRKKSTRTALVVVGAIVGVVLLAFIASTFIGDDDEATAPVITSAPIEGEGSIDPDTGEVVPAGCPPPEGTDEQTQTFAAAPPMCLDPERSYSAVFTTSLGEFTVELDQAAAPNTVNNFVFLARNQYFDDTNCHRIIPGFVVQCGDPEGTGSGGPGYRFPDELPEAGQYELGSLAMANSGPDTNGSQFFIITGEQGVALPPSYSLFGEVVAGFDDTVVPMEAAGSPSGVPSERVEILDVEIQVD